MLRGQQSISQRKQIPLKCLLKNVVTAASCYEPVFLLLKRPGCKPNKNFISQGCDHMLHRTELSLECLDRRRASSNKCQIRHCFFLFFFPWILKIYHFYISHFKTSIADRCEIHYTHSWSSEDEPSLLRTHHDHPQIKIYLIVDWLKC